MLIAAATMLAAAAVSASAEPEEQAVWIGRAGNDLDACLSVGEVTGLDPDGDNFLTVRAAPSSLARAKDRLAPGRWVWLCDRAGQWLGIVYGDGRDRPDDCGVGTPAPRPAPYAGSCRSGWVHSRYVRVVAG